MSRSNTRSNFGEGTTVRVGTNRSIPLRYQGRSGVVVGKATTARGAKQILVAFPGRRTSPLAVSARFVTS